MNQSIVHGIGTVLIHWAAAVGLLSVWAHSRVTWWHTVMGRHLMAYMGIMATVLILSCIANDIGDSWWFQLLRLVVFIGVPVVMTQRLWLQFKAQRTPADSTSSLPPEETP